MMSGPFNPKEFSMDVDAIGCTSVDFGTWDDDFFAVKGRSSTKVEEVADLAFESMEKSVQSPIRPLGGRVSITAEGDSRGGGQVSGQVDITSPDKKEAIRIEGGVTTQGDVTGRVTVSKEFQRERR